MGHYRFKAIELKSQDGKDIVEGFISTTDPDLYDDVVNDNAQKSILNQLKTRSIKLDFDHNKFRDPITGEVYGVEKNLIPPGKIIDAELRETEDGTLGVWAKVELNKDFEFYSNLINSIKNGFIDAFSIGYNVLKTIPHNTYRIIDDVIIRNVAFTGDPVNRNARVQIALKSLPKKMEETQITQEQFNELKSTHDSIKTELEELKSMDLQTKLDEANSKIEELKSQLNELNESKEVEVKSLENSQKKVVEMKSKLEANEIEIKSLKAKIEEYENEPQLKSFVQMKSQVSKELFGENNEPQMWRLGN